MQGILWASGLPAMQSDEACEMNSFDFLSKKGFCIFLFFLLCGFAFSQSISIANTLGGNTDNTESKDFFRFDESMNKDEISIGDRLQLDMQSESLDSRIRMDFVTDFSDSGGAFKIRGYLNYHPLAFLNLIAGNAFFSRWVIPASYLAANDDYPCHGKLTDTNGAGIVLQAGNITGSASIQGESELNLNLGLLYDVKNLLNIGFTFQDVTRESFSFSGYAGFSGVQNLVLNAGYSYNYMGSYVQSAQHVIQGSCGYNFRSIGLAFYAEELFALTNKRGNGSGERYFDTGCPNYTALRFVKKFGEDTTMTVRLSSNHELKSAKQNETGTQLQVYPYIEQKTTCGTIRAGLRILFSDSEGFDGLSIPFSWYYRIISK